MMGASRRRRAPVMADVGRLAGVSHQTVSRVLNGSPNVRADTRERVLAAMHELGYRPNPVARALVTGRSRTLGVVSFDTTLYGPASTLLGVERAAHQAGYFIIVASLMALTRDSVTEAIERLRRQGVDGVLVIAPFAEATEALPRFAPSLPLVAVETSAAGVRSVGVDQVHGAELAVTHLIELGHPTVWHIAGPPGFHEADERRAAWGEMLARARREIPEPLVGDWSAESGYRLGARLDPAASAIFVANDQMALGLLRALHESDRRVPADVSVVGFDDIPEAPYFLPPLTTVRQDFDEMGRRAVGSLLELLESRRGADAAAGESPGEGKTAAGESRGDAEAAAAIESRGDAEAAAAIESRGDDATAAIESRGDADATAPPTVEPTLVVRDSTGPAIGR